MGEVVINSEDINTKDARDLINELSNALKSITGSDGRASFNNDDMLDEKSIFAVARDKEGKAVGCGAFRYVDEETAEIKRMYVRKKSLGIGSKMMGFLEGQARVLKYKKIILETRIVNNGAVNFYKKNGYHVINNYGKYIGRKEAICFEKDI